MPKRTDINSILVIGAGPIVIGQACEFDYSGTQAVKALKEEGYRVVLVNSNPATIMTDPDLADATYIEPITPEIVAKIIEKERAARPDEKLVLLRPWAARPRSTPRCRSASSGVLDKFGVEMIGATADAIDKAEDRELFREAMGDDRARDAALGTRPLAGRGAEGARRSSACRRSSAPPSPSAAPAAASPTTARSSSTSSSAASTPRPPPRC